MKRHKAYKTELAPTHAQQETLRRWCGVRRWVYNWSLAYRQRAYKASGKSLTLYEVDKALTTYYPSGSYRPPLVDESQDWWVQGEAVRRVWGSLTPEDLERALRDLSWLKDPPRRVLYYAGKDLDEAFQAFFRRVKRGETPGYPRFKKKGVSRESFTVYGGGIRVETGRLRLPCMGWVKLKERGYIPLSDLENKRHMECTVSLRGGRWWVSVSVEEEVPDPEPGEGVRVAHPGARQLLTARDEDGAETRWEIHEVPTHLKKRIERLQRKLSRQEQGSNNRKKTKRKLEKTHARIRRIRKENTHRVSHTVVRSDKPAQLALQTWGIQKMMQQDDEEIPAWLRARIRDKISNANMAELLRQIRYKAEWEGVEIVEIDPDWPVSKTCSSCGAVNEDLGMEQTFRCPSCGYEADRETNATRNLLTLALDIDD